MRSTITKTSARRSFRKRQKTRVGTKRSGARFFGVPLHMKRIVLAVFDCPQVLPEQNKRCKLADELHDQRGWVLIKQGLYERGGHRADQRRVKAPADAAGG